MVDNPSSRLDSFIQHFWTEENKKSYDYILLLTNSSNNNIDDAIFEWIFQFLEPDTYLIFSHDKATIFCLSQHSAKFKEISNLEVRTFPDKETDILHELCEFIGSFNVAVTDFFEKGRDSSLSSLKIKNAQKVIEEFLIVHENYEQTRCRNAVKIADKIMQKVVESKINSILVDHLSLKCSDYSRSIIDNMTNKDLVNIDFEPNDVSATFPPAISCGSKIEVKYPPESSGVIPSNITNIAISATISIRFKSYIGTVGRTYFINHTTKQKKAYNSVLLAREKCIKSIKHGVKFSEIYKTFKENVDTEYRDYIPDCIGTLSGIQIKSDYHKINAESEEEVKPNTMFVLIFGLQDCPIESKDPSMGNKFSFQITDTFQVGETEEEIKILSLTNPSFHHVSYNSNQNKTFNYNGWNNNNNFAYNATYNSIISFISPSLTPQARYFYGDQKALYLLDEKCKFDPFKYLSYDFIITTNNNSSSFNTDMLIHTSHVISEFINDNPHHLQYHLNIDDDLNVLGKFEKMYRGESIVFEEDELPTCYQITNMLNIFCLPRYLIIGPQNMQPYGYGGYNNINNNQPQVYDAVINKQQFHMYLQANLPNSFTIKTKKNEYECNNVGIHSSSVIEQFIKSNPYSTVYDFDFADEFDEFQPICDFFNFKLVSITANNIESVKKIAEQLQINIISKEADTFIDVFDKFIGKIDEQEETVGKINDLFDLLFSINDQNVETIKDNITKSDWSKTEDNVKELAAFIIEVVEYDFLFHHQLADLLIKLDEQKDDTNKLDILLPFIVKKLLCSFGSSSKNCSFIYNLYKRGAIPKETIDNKLKLTVIIFPIPNNNNQGYYNQVYCNQMTNECRLQYSINSNLHIIYWFFPEIIEMNRIKSIDMINENSTHLFIYLLFKTYFDKIDLYKKMRDSGEPDDEITLVLRHDDLERLQTILSGQLNIKEKKVPFNIYEEFVDNNNTKYLNYAAAYGSVKCFKYLLLNHDTLDSQTMRCAVYGGNNEIIKIVDQKKDEISKNDDFRSYNQRNGLGVQAARKGDICGVFFGQNGFMDYGNSSPIVSTITKHQNDLFDWIFENNLDQFAEYEYSFIQLVRVSLICGNIHSLYSIFEKCFEMTKKLFTNQQIRGLSFADIIEIPARKGYYLLLKSLIDVFQDIYKNECSMNPSNTLNYLPNYHNTGYTVSSHNDIFDFVRDKTCSVFFENLSIFKLFVNKFTQNELVVSLSVAIYLDSDDIIKYIFNTIAREGSFKVTQNTITQVFTNAAMKESGKIFNYLLEQYKIINPTIFDDYCWPMTVLTNACKYKNIEISIKLTDIILKQNQKTDFTAAFQSALSSQSTELCRFFIDKKVYINFTAISDHSSPSMSQINKELFSLLIDNSSPYDQFIIYNNFLPRAIDSCNKEIVEYIFKANPDIDTGLYEAVQTHDCELVKLILRYKSEPSFINKVTQDGTALTLAVQWNDVDIVKILLSVPGIDLNLYDRNRNTPLIIAALNFNNEIFNLIIEKIGDDFQNHRWQLDIVVKNILMNLNNPEIKKTDPNITKFIDNILAIKYIDPNIFENNYSLITYACETNNVDIVKKLLTFENIDVNIYDIITGKTCLMVSIENDCVEIAEILINFPKTNINAEDNFGQSALALAVSKDAESIVNLLINNERFNPKLSRFNYAFAISIGTITDILFKSKYININENMLAFPTQRLPQNVVTSKYNNQALNIHNTIETPLICAVKNNNKKVVDLILQHPEFDKKKSKLYEAIFLTSKENNLEMYRKLIKLIDDDFNNFTYNGNGILSYITDLFNLQNFLNFINLGNNNNNDDTDDDNNNNDDDDNNNYGDDDNNDYGDDENNNVDGEQDAYNNNKIIKPWNANNNNFKHGKSNNFRYGSSRNIRYGNANNFNYGNANNFNYGNANNFNYGNANNFNYGNANNFNFGNTNTHNINNNNTNTFTEILNHPTLVFNSTEINLTFNNLVSALQSGIEADLSTLINQLIEYDEKHNHYIDINKPLFYTQIQSQFTCLTLVSRLNINLAKKYVDFFLEHGADPNVADPSGNYPLQLAILSNNYETVVLFMNTNKIDYNIRIPDQMYNVPNRNNMQLQSLNLYMDPAFSTIQLSDYPKTTYLHLAARSANPHILNEFLNRNVIDINVEDDDGNTSLIDACKFNLVDNIERLFQVENLDFLHCNKYGQDALKEFSLRNNRNINLPKQDDEEKILDKDEYFQKLMLLFNGNYNYNRKQPQMYGTNNFGFGKRGQFNKSYPISSKVESKLELDEEIPAKQSNPSVKSSFPIKPKINKDTSPFAFNLFNSTAKSQENQSAKSPFSFGSMKENLSTESEKSTQANQLGKSAFLFRSNDAASTNETNANTTDSTQANQLGNSAFSFKSKYAANTNGTNANTTDSTQENSFKNSAFSFRSNDAANTNGTNFNSSNSTQANQLGNSAFSFRSNDTANTNGTNFNTSNSTQANQLGNSAFSFKSKYAANTNGTNANTTDSTQENSFKNSAFSFRSNDAANTNGTNFNSSNSTQANQLGNSAFSFRSNDTANTNGTNFNTSNSTQANQLGNSAFSFKSKYAANTNGTNANTTDSTQENSFKNSAFSFRSNDAANTNGTNFNSSNSTQANQLGNSAFSFRSNDTGSTNTSNSIQTSPFGNSTFSIRSAKADSIGPGSFQTFGSFGAKKQDETSERPASNLFLFSSTELPGTIMQKISSFDAKGANSFESGSQTQNEYSLEMKESFKSDEKLPPLTNDTKVRQTSSPPSRRRRRRIHHEQEGKNESEIASSHVDDAPSSKERMISKFAERKSRRLNRDFSDDDDDDGQNKMAQRQIIQMMNYHYQMQFLYEQQMENQLQLMELMQDKPSKHHKSKKKKHGK